MKATTRPCSGPVAISRLTDLWHVSPKPRGLQILRSINVDQVQGSSRDSILMRHHILSIMVSQIWLCDIEVERQRSVLTWIGNGRLSLHTLATNASHADGQVELDVHNLWGMMEEKATHLALQDIIPKRRPFIISRSTFPSSGKWTGHWVCLFSAARLFFWCHIDGVLPSWVTILAYGPTCAII